MTTHRSTTGIALAVALLGATLGAAPAAAQSAVVDTAATNALERMGDYLSRLQQFQVNAVITKEEVLTDGQKVQLASTANVVAVRPNRLRVAVDGDRQQRLMLYDGTNFTLYAPQMKYYATAAAPGTIVELADTLEKRFNIDLPLVDLFRWVNEDARIGQIREARVVGPSAIDGITCTHYAFRQDGLDWEVWIQRGENPLPRKVVLNTLTDDARPQYTAAYTWNLAPSYGDRTFTFTAPADAHQINFSQVRPAYASRQP